MELITKYTKKIKPIMYVLVTCLTATILGLSNTANAGIITGVSSITGPGLGSADAVITTNSEGNDNVTGPNTNSVTITKSFDSVAPIDIDFNVKDSGFGVGNITEYFFSETVTNNTGKDWIDYHIALGFSIPNFDPSRNPDELDFDEPRFDPPPTSSAFTLLETILDPDILNWSGGLVPNGETVNFTFSVDVPNLNIRIPLGAQTTEGYRFTLRQIPTIPEPNTLLLLIGGALFLSLSRYKTNHEIKKSKR